VTAPSESDAGQRPALPGDDQRDSRALAAVNLGLGANLLLAAAKTSVGILGHSPALLADGINSTSDVAYYVIVRTFMRLAHKPADEEHPYGHRQMESIAALIVGAFVLATAVTIFWDAVDRVYELLTGKSDYTGASSIALFVALGTVALKIVLTSVTHKIGKQTANPAVLALAYDHRNDIFAAVAASVGIVVGRAGYAWVDPLAGAVVAGVIFRTGLHIVRESSGDLMDAVPGSLLRDQITASLRELPDVLSVEEILAHRFGPYFVVNITVGVDGSLSVAEGDRIATRVEALLHRNIRGLMRVHVHYHPVSNESG